MNIYLTAKTELVGKTKDKMGILNPLEFAGLNGGVCYMGDTYEALLNQDVLKHQNRAKDAINNCHLSLYGHEHLTMCIEGVPKIVAMILNNTGAYNTSEKSARYTIMKDTTGREKELYDKWMNILTEVITLRYGDCVGEKKIKKLAQENARYMISVFTPTTMIFTISLLDLLFIIDNARRLANKVDTPFFKRLAPHLIELADNLETLLRDTYNNEIANELLKITDFKRDGFSLFRFEKDLYVFTPEHFGFAYTTKYKGTFAQLAQAQRHRTLDYVLCADENMIDDYYIPEIIQNTEYAKEWYSDISSVADQFPQGSVIKIIETGSFNNFLLKTRERECACAQLEIQKQTMKTHQKYLDNCYSLPLSMQKTLRDYSKMIRCQFSDPFKCKKPCEFKGEEKKTRLI